MSQVSEIWMFVFEEGSASAKEINLHFDKESNYLRGPILDMVRQNQLARIPRDYGDTTSRVKFTVTGECVIPAGIKLKEILK